MMHLKIASKCGYQVFITRTYVKELNKQRTYDVLFEEIKKNTENNNNIIITPKNFHCDFEKDYEIKHWNYYDNIKHITNNASESFNNYLNNLFPKKSHF
ncbi:hypothetical protein H8356DRAFT_1335075 [Neocallimastix lanati (nom. inval.)]|nr:hypothetical protein H8356DRAFT_1335075 [Neocallimastix sp. JGI-2020a]